jgi:hypothetical protein
MDLDTALRDLAEAVTAADGRRGRDARMRAIRQVVVSRFVALLGRDVPGQPSLGDVIRMATEAPMRPCRRACAVLLLHALAVPGVIPSVLAGEVSALAESALRDVLLRCGYPFGAPVGEKMHVLERLHSRLNELMQPLEPTFPNWQGLYAG